MLLTRRVWEIAGVRLPRQGMLRRGQCCHRPLPRADRRDGLFAIVDLIKIIFFVLLINYNYNVMSLSYNHKYFRSEFAIAELGGWDGCDFGSRSQIEAGPVGRHEGPGQNLNQSPDGHLVTTHLLDNNHREGLDCLTLTECESVLSITCTYSPDGMRICFPPTCPSRIYTHYYQRLAKALPTCQVSGAMNGSAGRVGVVLL